jgi:hypothetical protein
MAGISENDVKRLALIDPAAKDRRLRVETRPGSSALQSERQQLDE